MELWIVTAGDSERDMELVIGIFSSLDAAEAAAKDADIPYWYRMAEPWTVDRPYRESEEEDDRSFVYEVQV